MLLMALSLAACGEDDSGSDGGASCFGGEDLAWQYVALLTVRDAATMATVAHPKFTISGTEVTPTCYVPNKYNLDLSEGLCDRWNIGGIGSYTVTVQADGYTNATVDINTEYTLPNGCPAHHQVEKTVDLQHL